MSAPRRPRIVVIGALPPPLHGNTVFLDLLLGSDLVRERFDVHHVDTSDRRDLSNIGRLDLTNVLLGLRHAARLARTMIRVRPDVVYLPVAQNTWGYLRDALFIVIGRALGGRVVTHLHGSHFARFHRRAPTPVRWVIRLTQRMVTSAWILSGRIDAYDGLVPSERVRVVPNGVATRAPRPTPARSSTVLFLGQLSVAKGVLEALRATATVAARRPDVRLVLAGGWLSTEDRRSAEALINELEIGDRVSLPGVVDGEEKDALFRDAAVFVLPSRAEPGEGQPLTILEAMAFGVPVVATPRGGIPDVVVDGETGFLVPDEDPAALADAIARVLDDPELAERLGRNGRARQAERFSHERCVERVAELWEEAAGSARSSSAAPRPAGVR